MWRALHPWWRFAVLVGEILDLAPELLWFINPWNLGSGEGASLVLHSQILTGIIISVEKSAPGELKFLLKLYFTDWF